MSFFVLLCPFFQLHKCVFHWLLVSVWFVAAICFVYVLSDVYYCQPYFLFSKLFLPRCFIMKDDMRSCLR